MKKKALILIFCLISSLTFAQRKIELQKYESPQTVSWNEPADLPATGTIEYEVYLIRLDERMLLTSEMRDNASSYILFNKTSSTSIAVDLGTGGLEGDFVVAIRTVHTYNNVTQRSDFIYSDGSGGENDLDPGQEPFFLRYTKGIGKPQRMLFNP
jgi:hypothetical protein